MNGSWLAGDIFQRLRDHLAGKTHQKKKEKRPTKKRGKTPTKKEKKTIQKKGEKEIRQKKGQNDQQKIDFDFGKMILII